MLTSATTVVERRTVIRHDHVTHPYEAGWALEAMFFIQVEGAHPDLTLRAQVSPDGLTWLDHGESVTLTADASAAAVVVHSFGTWLRLAIDGADSEDPAQVLVHLAMKG
jgi:hypothetical protein